MVAPTTAVTTSSTVTNPRLITPASNQWTPSQESGNAGVGIRVHVRPLQCAATGRPVS